MVRKQPWALIASAIPANNTAITVAYGLMLGGFITNPLTASEQGLAVEENLYIDLVSTASDQVTATTYVITPGSTFPFPPGFTGQVSVNAATGGHRFSGLVLHVPTDFVPADDSLFPPSGPTTLTAVIPSYLYLQYNDDEDLQEFVDAYNALTQQYVTWFATVMLPVYTSQTVSGTLLDWVAAGLYGMIRPSLPTGQTQNLGMLNTIMFNTLPLNEEDIIGPQSYYATNDDIFRRILTWHLYKGDGKIFNIRWLKRRVERFLTGTNGTGGQTDQTYDVSVTFGVGNQVNINIQSTRRTANGGAIIGAGLLNNFEMNEFDTVAYMVPISPYVGVLKAAIDSGVLELPFQFTYVVNTN